MHITDTLPKRPRAVPAYFLGRSAEVYRRRYQRMAPRTHIDD